jgi:hypothetical protein
MREKKKKIKIMTMPINPYSKKKMNKRGSKTFKKINSSLYISPMNKETDLFSLFSTRIHREWLISSQSVWFERNERKWSSLVSLFCVSKIDCLA